jgi:hypothetical protein
MSDATRFFRQEPSHMKVAFYAPMKPPTSTAPSGDRLIGRLFMKAKEIQTIKRDLKALGKGWLIEWCVDY